MIFNDIDEKENLNINIICDEKAKTVPCSNYYLYFCIIMLVIFIMLYSIFNLCKSGNKVKKTKIGRKRLYP